MLKIVCPHCSEELNEETIKEFVPERIHKKYKTFLRNIKVNTNPLCKWCPNPKCSDVITLPKERAPKGKCGTCSTEVCGLCGRLYHGGISCKSVITLLTTEHFTKFFLLAIRYRIKILACAERLVSV